MVRVFSFLILLCSALQLLLAQRPTPVREDESQCGMTHVNNPDVIRKAEQNTRAKYPGLDEVMRRSLEKATPQILGTQEIFWTYNFKDNRYDTVRAELLAIGALSYVWVAVGELSKGHVTQGVVDTILQALESKTPRTSQDSTKGILRLARRFFGDPPNIAGDGKTHFLVYDIVDRFDETRTFVAGYFNSNDQLPRDYSNRRDMLYIDSFPGIFFNNQRDPQRPHNVLAHEFQHLIHWNYDPGETLFFNEGLSELAEFLCGFGLRSPNRYLSNPNVALLGWTTSPSDNRVLADYSRAALMGYYLWDRYGETFIRSLTQQPRSSSDGFNAALNASGFSGNLVEVVKNFQVANYVQDRSVGLSYGYAIPLEAMGRPRLQRDNFGPISSGVRTGVQPLGVEYLRLRMLDSLRGAINITSGVGDVQVIRTSSSGTTVSGVPSNSQYQTSFIGSSHSEVVFLVHNTRTANLSYSYVTNGLIKENGVLELSHDDGRTQRAPTTAVASNDTLHVAFEGVTKSKIDSVAMWFQTTGSASLMVRDWNSDYDISFQPRSGLSGRARLVAPITFSVTDTGFFKTVVDLRQRNVGANSDFLVQIIYGLNAPHPLMRRDSAQRAIRSFLSIRSEPTPGRVIYQSTGAFYVRVYLSFTEQEVDQPPLAINTIVLRQNYPNPFFVRSTQPTTTIEYGIPADSHVRLEIFDLLGRRVRLLEDRSRFAGFASVEWDGRDDTRQPVPSGVYLIRVQAGGLMQTKKMILLH